MTQIKDHELEERNTIEWQSVTALAHLKAAIIYIVDISEQCGTPIPTQIALFNKIKPLFVNKVCYIAFARLFPVFWQIVTFSLARFCHAEQDRCQAFR